MRETLTELNCGWLIILALLLSTTFESGSGAKLSFLSNSVSCSSFGVGLEEDSSDLDSISCLARRLKMSP